MDARPLRRFQGANVAFVGNAAMVEEGPVKVDCNQPVATV
jgi:hypothetical protein